VGERGESIFSLSAEKSESASKGRINIVLLRKNYDAREDFHRQNHYGQNH
jgi:hypothetical protein